MLHPRFVGLHIASDQKEIQICIESGTKEALRYLQRKTYSWGNKIKAM